ncbi:ribose 5-phosphate isomerase A [Candidatus Bathyarchaeota archaeon]|nr:ribose 5-phosphate isomerase A [Candidatus Bathyarchaeota archaeon]
MMKRRASEKAVEHVESGFIVGLGSGTTATLAIRLIGERLRAGILRDILGVPTSLQAAQEAISSGIPLTTLDEHPEIDVTIDGADQIDHELRAIKGGGGALLREKVVASSSRLRIVVADETKLTERLGVGCPVPVEVHPFAIKPVYMRLLKMGAKPRIRTGTGKLGPVVTDNGNLIIDVSFNALSDPKRLEESLKAIPGVLETGLFIDLIDLAYIGTREDVRRLGRVG